LLKRQTLTSQVIDHILGLIKSRNYKPGDRLPTEKQLTESLGVSRTCVREAMKSLESLRLISVRPRVGAVVLEPSPTAVFSAEHLSTAAHQHQTDVLVEFRGILEVGLAALAAERATEEDLAAMQKAIHAHKRALETDNIAYPADIAFHEALAKASKNPFAIMVLNMISEPLAVQRRAMNHVPNAAEDGLRDHGRIYRALKERNADKTRSAMRAHMKTIERYARVVSATHVKDEHGKPAPVGPEPPGEASQPALRR
jgi:GntR family transcriptional repressor for pyruvate dehydrogenase complex